MEEGKPFKKEIMTCQNRLLLFFFVGSHSSYEEMARLRFYCDFLSMKYGTVGKRNNNNNRTISFERWTTRGDFESNTELDILGTSATPATYDICYFIFLFW